MNRDRVVNARSDAAEPQNVLQLGTPACTDHIEVMDVVAILASTLVR